MLTNQVIFEAIDAILKRSISDVDKAKAILSFMSSNGVEVWQIKNATGFSEDQINDFLALANPAPIDVPVYYPSNVDLFSETPRITPEGVVTGGRGYERGPGKLSYEYLHSGTPLAFNVTLFDRLLNFMNDAQQEVAGEIFQIIGRAAQTGTNPSAALEAINAQYDGFASKLIADIGLGGQMRKYTGNANFYGGGPSPDVQAQIDRPAYIPNERQLEIYATLPDGSPTPTGPKAVIPKRVVADAGATKPPLSPADVKIGITTPVVKVPVTPSETPTPTPVTISNVLPLALAAIAFYFLG